jgi:2-polyprenyl-6-hydroxyphenyl methylase/3-demethylubiquinone-9 3-methyltransferase
MMDTLAASKTRFPFGENWSRFLAQVDETRIGAAQASLVEMLGESDLSGKTFLDIGSGSGLSSLAARRLGARVLSFDDDPQSVACTAELKRRYFPGDPLWSVTKGSALDEAFLRGLGPYDIVYSWGVLHHTGALWRALDLAATGCAANGRLFIAIYNDQGWITRYWRVVKRLYNRGTLGRFIVITIHAPYLILARLLFRALTGRGPLPRGMSLWRDMRDWLGGWPFEAAPSADVITFCEEKGFSLLRERDVGRRHGCNEFVFVRKSPR